MTTVTQHRTRDEFETLALGHLGALHHRATLEGALQDEDWTVRVAAAEALRRLGDPAALPALRARQADPHRVVRNAVSTALKHLGPATES